MKIYKILPFVFLTIFSRITAQNTFPATGNVGIGTSSPTSSLDVNGIIKTSGGVEVKGLDASKTYIRFSNGSTSVGMSGSAYNYTGNAADNNDFGHYVYGNNNYRLFTNGSERLRVTGNGNVGINTASNTSKLEVYEAVGTFGKRVASFIGNYISIGDAASINQDFAGKGIGIKFRDEGVTHTSVGLLDGYFRISQTSNDGEILFPASRNDWFVISNSNGNVGIGTISPISRLTVQSAYSQNAIVMNLNNPYGYGVGLGAASTILRFNHTPYNGGSTGVIADIIGVSESETSSTTGALAFATRNGLSEVTTERMRINSVGNVGIGTISPRTKLDINGNVAIGMPTDKAYPSNYKLAIGGNALAEKMVVKLQTNWPDYVFHSDYALPPLSQVEEHIKAKGHLPNIPTEKEVKETGIDLGDMNAKLLQKIEELTLYLIEIKKQNEENDKKFQLLQEESKKEIQLLKEEIKKLKSK